MDVIAVSEFTTYPAEAANKPTIGPPLNPSLGRIVALNPDLVVGSGDIVQFSAVQYRLSRSLFVRAAYTYLEAVIQRSFSSDAIGPTYNPNFPSIPIGAYSPLVGAHPFRRAPHSGYLGLSYAHGRLSSLLTGTWVGRRDDSDCLAFDVNYAPTMLLPNRNLDVSYQRLDPSINYRLNRDVQLTSRSQNLLSEHMRGLRISGAPLHLPVRRTSDIWRGVLESEIVRDEYALQLGVHVESGRIGIVVTGSLLAAIAVSLGGLIGFVRLIIPHLARLIAGPDHVRLLSITLLTGASFVVLTDTLARTVMAPSEIPAGILMAFLGGPFFLYLLRRTKQGYAV